MKKFTDRQLCLALYTASQWSSSDGKDEGGLAMLSLSSTRKVHNEKHRARLIANIKKDIAWLLDYGYAKWDDGYKGWVKDITRLVELLHVVMECSVGEEWLSDRDNMRINDRLYDAGKL